MASSTTSIRAESTQQASNRTNYSMIPPSVSTRSSPRRTRRRDQSSQDAHHCGNDGQPLTDHILSGIGNHLKPASWPAHQTDSAQAHDADGADARQAAMPQGPDELDDTLKRMHRENMAARKKRARAQANSEAGASTSGSGSGDANANANKGASNL